MEQALGWIKARPTFKLAIVDTQSVPGQEKAIVRELKHALSEEFILRTSKVLVVKTSVDEEEN